MHDLTVRFLLVSFLTGNFITGNKNTMERSKASFLLPVLVVGGLVLVLAGARKPETGVAGGNGGEVRAAAASALSEKGSGNVGGSRGGEEVRTGAAGTGVLGERGAAGGVEGSGIVEMGRSRDGIRTGAAGTAISWMTIEQAAGKLKEVKKPLIIDLYTTWCGWCKQMDRKTYSNKQVAEYLQEKFYTVKMDAETQGTVNWAGKTYNFNSQYRANEFALYLTHGRLEFPTTIIIVPGEEPQAIPGYMEPKELEVLVKYFGEGDYRSKSFDDYQKNFKASW